MRPAPKALERRAARTLVATPVEIPPISVSVDDGARLIGITDRFLETLLATGEIPSFKQGRRRLIRVAALQEWAAAKETATTRERERLRAIARQQVAPFPIGRRRKAG